MGITVGENSPAKGKLQPESKTVNINIAMSVFRIAIILLFTEQLVFSSGFHLEQSAIELLPL